MKSKHNYLTYGIIILAIVGIVFISGCTSDRTYEQPDKIESTPTQTQPETPTTTPPAEPEKPKVSTFKVGESASDGRLKITVNGVSFKDKITYSQTTEIMGEEYTSSFDFKPKENYQFLVLDITIENLQTDKTSSISSLLFFKISDADGYSYDYSLGTAYLDRKWEDGDILPGMKKRGSVAFEVPKNPVGLKFAFQFDIAGQTAVFELQ